MTASSVLCRVDEVFDLDSDLMLGWDVHGHHTDPDVVDVLLDRLMRRRRRPVLGVDGRTVSFDVTWVWRHEQWTEPYRDMQGEDRPRLLVTYHDRLVDDSTPVTRVLAHHVGGWWCVRHTPAGRGRWLVEVCPDCVNDVDGFDPQDPGWAGHTTM